MCVWLVRQSRLGWGLGVGVGQACIAQTRSATASDGVLVCLGACFEHHTPFLAPQGLHIDGPRSFPSLGPAADYGGCRSPSVAGTATAQGNGRIEHGDLDRPRQGGACVICCTRNWPHECLESNLRAACPRAVGAGLGAAKLEIDIPAYRHAPPRTIGKGLRTAAVGWILSKRNKDMCQAGWSFTHNNLSFVAQPLRRQLRWYTPRGLP